MMAKPELIDLRKFCRDSDTARAQVLLKGERHMEPWIELGQIKIQLPTTLEGRNTVLSAYLGEHTDREHDSAYAISLPLIGVTITSVYYHVVTLQGWIDPNCFGFDEDRFRVPTADYDLMAGAEACTWEHCKEDHKIVEYLPPFDQEIYEQVRGKPVEIRIGPTSAWEND